MTQGPAPPGRKVVMLGLDGACWSWLDSSWARATLPTLTALLDRSSKGTLRSTFVPYTAPAWTSITTGVEPGRHGIFGFTDGDGRPVSDAAAKAPRVWDYVSQVDGRSIVVNVPLTYPARDPGGSLVAGMPAPRDDRSFFPRSLAAEVDRLAGRQYEIDVPIVGSPKRAGVIDRLTTMTEARGELVASLARREPWDLLAVVYVLPDRLFHPWFKYLVPGGPFFEGSEGAAVRADVGVALEALDRAVADLLDALPSGTTVVTCSDHGFGPIEADVFFDVALAEHGLIPKAGGGLRRVIRRLGMTRLADAVPRALVERAKGMVGNAASAGGRAWTAPKYEGGIVLADANDEEMRARVTSLLLDLTGPDGRKVVESVKRREDVFRGDWVAGAPDLLPVMARSDIELHEGMHAGSWWVSRSELGWGMHHPDGIVAIDGAKLSSSRDPQAVDIAATLLHALGLKAEDIDGSSLLEDDAALTSVSASGSVGTTEGYNEEQEAQVMEHLKGLGYVE